MLCFPWCVSFFFFFFFQAEDGIRDVAVTGVQTCALPISDLLLGYLEVIGLGTGILAFAMGWRCAFDVALFGYLFLAAAGAATALRSPLGCWLIASAALLTLHSTRRRYWPEARVGIVVVSWALLGASLGGIHGAEARTWLALGAAAAGAGLLWWEQLDPDPFAAVALASQRYGSRPGGRLAAAGLAAGAFVCLFSVGLWSREASAPVFSDPWALALYGYVAGTALCARWWGAEATPPGKRSGAELSWILCAAAVFAGGSIQFGRYFGRIAALAGDLALSLWWLAYAGALVYLGFRLNRKAVRSAGLAVAAGGGVQVRLFDFSALPALGRVAAFLALALFALSVA